MQTHPPLTPQKGGRLRLWLEILLGLALLGWGGYWAYWGWFASAGGFLAYGGICLVGSFSCWMHFRTVAAWLLRIAALPVIVTAVAVAFSLGRVPGINIAALMVTIGTTLFLFLAAHWLSRGSAEE